MLAIGRFGDTWTERMLPLAAATLYLFMLVQPRGFVAALMVVVLVLAVLLILRRRDLRPAPASLLMVALAVAATIGTAVSDPEGWLDRSLQPWLLLVFALAGFEVLRRSELRLPAWMLPTGVAVTGVAWLAMVALSLGFDAFAWGVKLETLNLIGHAFAKTLFLAVPAVWLLVGLWYRATGRRVVLWALALPLAMAVSSPSQSLSLGLLLGLAAALVAVRPWLVAPALGAVFLIPVVAVPFALLSRDAVALPENWAHRINLWHEGLRLAAERPLTGWGFQSFRELKYTAMDLASVNHAHSVSVELLIDFGAWGPAALTAVALCVAVVARRWGIGLGARLLVLPPLVAWLTIATISLGLWTDYVFGGAFFLLALALVRPAPSAARQG